MNNWTFRENSLDFLRLIAASQVMVLHSFEFTMNELTDSLFFELLRIFPGVPIFFFISGFLISRSFERAPSLSVYWSNRVLRIFPALIVCVFINLIMVWASGYFGEVQPSLFEITRLFIAKVTIFQFYNPDFMRAFGDGVLNGSLWTICVELQFYFMIPVLYKTIRLFERHVNLFLGVLIILFMLANRALYLLEEDYSDTLLWKLYRVSFAPWFYMFLFGVLVQKNFSFFALKLQGIKTSMLLLAYIFVMYLVSQSGTHFDNSISPLIFFPLAIVILRAAYSFTAPSKLLLRGNDISYGVYIWHMPFVNQLTYLTSANETIPQVIFVIFCTLIAALASWFLLEKQMLKLKVFSLNKIRT